MRIAVKRYVGSGSFFWTALSEVLDISVALYLGLALWKQDQQPVLDYTVLRPSKMFLLKGRIPRIEETQKCTGDTSGWVQKHGAAGSRRICRHS